MSNIVVYPNPIALGDYAPCRGEGLVYTGRVEYRKGVHLLIEGYAEAVRRATLPNLTLIGRPFGAHPDGCDYGEWIRNRIAERGLDDRVEWIRGVPHEQIPARLSQGSMAVFASLYDNFPYACLEAMAAGRAVAAPACGGFPEMIDHERNGLLFTPGDPRSLADQLVRLATSPDLVASLGARARETVRERFDIPATAEKAEQFYLSAIRRSGHER